MSDASGTVSDAVARIRRALGAACKKSPISLVALSGGLDSTIIAWHARLEGRPQGVAITARDFVSRDLAYCQMASIDLDVPLEISDVGTDELFDGISETIKILGNYNDIEIRNSVVMYMAIKWAADHGYDSIATGDGADELFAGYKFLINTPEEKLAGELERVRGSMHFTSHKIGRAFGVSVISPFLDEEVVQAAREIDASLKVGTRRPGREVGGRAPDGVGVGSVDGDGEEGGSGKTRHGKWILRMAFEDVIPRRIAWRPKAAMQDGAGTAGLTELFDVMMRMDAEAYAKKCRTIREEDGVTIRSSESMHYYEIFRGEFGIPSKFRAVEGAARVDGGDIMGDGMRRCPYCRYVVTADTRFCRMCAAFPI